ncbi:MAG: hypothetical protein AAGA03_20605, partial [Planctomycetota bacterium]
THVALAILAVVLGGIQAWLFSDTATTAQMRTIEQQVQQQIEQQEAEAARVKSLEETLSVAPM